MMIYKSVIPIGLKKRERVLWETSAYTAIAGIDDCQSNLIDALKGHLLELFDLNGVAVCIICRLPVIKIETIANLLKNSIILGSFEPKGDFLVRPGAVVALMNGKQDIENVAACWGTLDGIQFIFPFANDTDDLIKRVASERYVYCRHHFDVWNELMAYARVVITDTGVGTEFEMVYHKNDSIFID